MAPLHAMRRPIEWEVEAFKPHLAPIAGRPIKSPYQITMQMGVSLLINDLQHASQPGSDSI